MSEWPAELLSRRFAPREVTQLTGVDEGRQRLIANRHFDFRESSAAVGKQRRWTWEGVQTLAVFAAVMEDMQNAKIALELARGTDDRRHGPSYRFDLRSDEPDTLLVWYFGDRVLSGAYTINPDELAKLYTYGNTDVRPERVYTFNLSELQRRLADKLGATA